VHDVSRGETNIVGGLSATRNVWSRLTPLPEKCPSPIQMSGKATYQDFKEPYLFA
jgi:hypothetical protein